MSRETINLICAELPGTEKSDAEGGQDAWTVGGEMFARLGADGSGVAVRMPDAAAAEMLVATGMAGRSRGLAGAWVSLPVESPEAELRHRIAESYTLVRKALPQSIQVTLDRTSG